MLDGPAAQSGILTLTLKGHTVTTWDWAPAVIEGALPRPLIGIPAQTAFGQWSALTACAGLSPE